jgi:hypothetical protein
MAARNPGSWQGAAIPLARPSLVKRLVPGVMVVLAWMGPAAWCAAAASGEAILPVVGTRFEIVAPIFTDVLRAERRAACEAEIAVQMAERLRHHRSYLDWRPLTNPPAPTDPPWVLKVTMEQEGPTAIPAIVLVFQSVEPGSRSAVLFKSPLYPANSLEWDAQNDVRLLNDLRQTNEITLNNTFNIQTLQREFLCRIPLVNRLIVNPTFERFLVPTPWGILLPGEGSVLRASYRATRQSTPIPVQVKLIPSEEWPDGVGCRVREFNFPPTFISNATGEHTWHQTMPESLSNAIPDSIRVFMDAYQKDHTFGTANGLVTDFATSTAGGTP